MSGTTEERVDTLENLLGQFIMHNDVALRRMEKDTQELKKEMREFKMHNDEALRSMEKDTQELKKEMREFKIHNEAALRSMEKDTQEFKMHNDEALRRMEEDTQELKKEMREFKNEMSDFKREMREDRKKAFEQWGNLANRIGTLAEDVVAPCVRSIAEKYFGCKDEEDFMVRRFKRKLKDRGSRREFDVIVVYDDTVVIADVKSTPRAQYIDDFVKVLKEFYDYFPEYTGRKLAPIFASLYLPDEVIAALTRNAIYAMATREDMMDLMNYEAVAAAMKKPS